MLSGREKDAFILKGYAGTGKTSLVGALVRLLDSIKQKVILIAPTGRAAKVFSLHAGHPAYTIHKKIYRQKVFNGEGGNYTLSDNLHQHTLFIVDNRIRICRPRLPSVANWRHSPASSHRRGRESCSLKTPHCRIRTECNRMRT